MTDDIRREFNNFVSFISKLKDSDPTEYRDTLYREIDHLTKIIEKAPDREKLEHEFFQLFDPFDISPIHRRARQKPLGYAGDYLLIDWIYTQKTAPSGQEKLFDVLFHSYEATQSVRNRKNYFVKKCIEFSDKKKSRLDILNVGCGPCRDVLETYQSSVNGNNLYFHCVDHEPEAIEYAKKLLADTGAKSNIRLDCVNCFKIKTSKKYDLIWSAGIFDYLEDRRASLLLRKLWRYLKDNGQIIFGNFSPKNPTKKGMEYGCRWYLIHRTTDDLIKLCRTAQIPFSELEIESEPLGINLFCIIKK